jgi:sirohydrochlorin cobaltochelatase
MKRTGILLFAHGARDPAWARPFEAAAMALRAKSAQDGSAQVDVTLAFLEFMSPDLLTAGRDLAGQGCTEVSVVPLFLGAGGHVRKDLPRLLGELAAAHPEVNWTLRAAVGETELLIQALADAAWMLATQPAPLSAAPPAPTGSP